MGYIVLTIAFFITAIIRLGLIKNGQKTVSIIQYIQLFLLPIFSLAATIWVYITDSDEITYIFIIGVILGLIFTFYKKRKL